ncbi:MAG: hypothetical protein PHW10_01015 [Candidatus Peribacteraceae bacterium]|nr:hypothetical protein [Candidatus Peribacteraceae bacterium]
MSNLTLSWDLFIIVFFAIVITYTFIIGKKESVKVIIATYIAIVAVQGIGNVLLRVGKEAGLTSQSLLGLSPDLPVFSVFKLLLFIVLMILLTVKAGIGVHYARETTLVNIIVTVLCGAATAGLLLSTLLTYVSNLPILDLTMPQLAQLSPIIQQSPLMQLMIYNQDLWFAGPAVVLIGAGFASNA